MLLISVIIGYFNVGNMVCRHGTEKNVNIFRHRPIRQMRLLDYSLFYLRVLILP